MPDTASYQTPLGWAAPLMMALAYILLSSAIREPHRKTFSAIMVAGAGAAYLSGGGFGFWEMVFVAIATPWAFLGLRSYRFIGIAWLLHAGWDILHHLYGHPMLPFDRTSSLGCAICDPILALWFFLGAPSAWELLRFRRREPQNA